MFARLTIPRSTVPKSTILAATAAFVVGAEAPAEAQERGEAFVRTAEDETMEWAPCPEFMPEGRGIAVLHGNPAERNADILFRLQGGETAPRHWHSSAERMLLLTGEMEVDYDGQDPVLLTAGTYAYGPPELPHSATCQSSEACILFIAFEEPIDAVEGAPE